MTDRFAAFRYSSYARYFISRFFTSFSVQVLSVAVGWQIYDATRDPALLGWIGLVQFLPALCLVVVTGNVADRLGRRLVMACAMLLMMACAGAILYLATTDQFAPVLVLSVLTLFGVARAFMARPRPALRSILCPGKCFPMRWGGYLPPGSWRRLPDR